MTERSGFSRNLLKPAALEFSQGAVRGWGVFQILQEGLTAEDS